MEERGPWARVLIAAAVVVIIGGLAYAGFLLGQFAVVFSALKTFYEGQGVPPEDAGNVAAGSLQTVVDVVLLTGVLTLYGFVDRGFKKHARRQQAARAVLGAYVAFVRALEAVRARQKNSPLVEYNQAHVATMARLRRAVDDLGTRSFFFADVFSPAANEAMDDVREKLSYVYAFIDNVLAWAASDSPDPKRATFAGYIRSRSPVRSADFVMSIQADMERFLANAYVASGEERKFKQKLAATMSALSQAASRFIVVERPKDPAALAADDGS